MGHKWFHRSFWRFYLHSIVIIITVSITAFVVANLIVGPTALHGIHKRVTQNLAQEQNPQRLQEKLTDIYDLSKMEIAIYQKDGTLVASAGPNPPWRTERKTCGHSSRRC